MQTKIDRQLELEEEMLSLGVTRYENKVRKAMESEQYSLVKPITEIMKTCIEPMILLLAKEKLNNRGRNHEILSLLNHFDNRVIALETSRHIMSFFTNPRLTAVALRVADALVAELNYREFLEHTHEWTDPNGVQHTMTGTSYVKNVESVKNRQNTSKTELINILRQMFYEKNIEYTKWDKALRLRIGVKLVNIFIEATGLFTLETEYGKSRQLYLKPDPRIYEWLESQNSLLATLSPMLWPMIVKPNEWHAPYGGGYLSARSGLRRGLFQVYNKEHKALVKNTDMPKVYAAVNAIQNTAWRINKQVYEVASYLWEHSIDLADIPSREPLEAPSRPWGQLEPEEWVKYKEENPTIVKEWKEKARNTHNLNATLQGKRISTRMKMIIAEKYKDEEEIFFTCFLDWRGRVYILQSDVTPQGDDLGKALLEFAEAKPLGERGAYWLAIHGANCAGVDKVSFEDRIAWVEENEALILATANDPLSTMHWWGDELGADKPFGFLAFCFEWAGYKALGASFESRLAVALDGSCNGIQHLSAMLGDVRGARAVNLLPSDKPNDIYQEVADEAKLVVAKDASKGDLIALKLLPNINRSIVKRNVMTTPYGATKRGMVEQLKEDHGLYNDEASYLAKINYDSIGKVVVASRQAMGWLQDVAGGLASCNKSIQWVTPSGYPVVHSYFKSDVMRIESYWGSLRISLTLRKENPLVVSKAKQVSGIAPNLVHSFDAAHLQNTVDACVTKGITSFAMIHDSYGVHAADTDLLALTLREEFVKIYSEDVLTNLYDSFKCISPDCEIPLPPAKGGLDINSVMQSKYFFA